LHQQQGSAFNCSISINSYNQSYVQPRPLGIDTIGYTAQSGLIAEKLKTQQNVVKYSNTNMINKEKCTRPTDLVNNF
jgi:hypothetical protein